MAINASTIPSSGGGPVQPPIPVGTHLARVVRVIDLGLQPQSFGGEIKPPKREIEITYELASHFRVDENGVPDPTKPRWLVESFPLNSLSQDKAKSTKRIMAIDPKKEANGDLSLMLGNPVLVTVVQKPSRDGTRVYSNVGQVTPPIEGVPYPPLKNDPVFFDLEVPDLQLYAGLSKYTQEKIQGNLEYPGSKLAKLLGGASANNNDYGVKQVMPGAAADMDDVPF